MIFELRTCARILLINCTLIINMIEVSMHICHGGCSIYNKVRRSDGVLWYMGVVGFVFSIVELDSYRPDFRWANRAVRNWCSRLGKRTSKKGM